jgi:putative membrane protein
MLCIGCGTFNTEDSIYCKKCGSPIEPEEETRVAPKREMIANEPDEEQRIFSITPTLKFVYAGYVLAVVSAFVVVAIFSVFLLQFVSAWLGVLIGMSLLLVPAFYHIRQKLVRYTLTDTKVEIDEGLISRTTLNVPLRRVQDVTVKATIPQRLLGLGDIVVDNAGTDGGRTILKNVDSPRKYADQLLRQLRRLER